VCVCVRVRAFKCVCLRVCSHQNLSDLVVTETLKFDLIRKLICGRSCNSIFCLDFEAKKTNSPSPFFPQKKPAEPRGFLSQDRKVSRKVGFHFMCSELMCLCACVYACVYMYPYMYECENAHNHLHVHACVYDCVCKSATVSACICVCA